MSSRQSGDNGGVGPIAALGLVITSASKLMRNEISLVKAEAARAAFEAKGALIKLLIAAVLAMVGLNVLAGAIVAAIIEAGLSPMWAAVIVGAVFLALALGYAQSARSALKVSNLMPGRSGDSLRKDADTLASALKGADRNA